MVMVSFAMPVATAYAAESYTVRFYTSDENYTVQTVSAGSYATLPATPTRTGHVFKGWTLDNTVSKPTIVSVSTYKINEDTDFYAVFQANVYKVTFVYFNTAGIEVSKSQNVTYGNYAIAPDIPLEVNGSTFLSWDADITTPITATITFTAEYNPQYFTVSYYDDEGEIIDTVSRSGLQDISDFEAPAKEGFKFKGWATSISATTVINDTYRISEDTSLYAVYSIDWIARYLALDLIYQILIPVGILVGVSLVISILRSILFGGRRRY